MNTENKHKFKRARRFVYTVVAYCVHCGCEREGTKGNYSYPTTIGRYGSGRAIIRHLIEPPPCIGGTKDVINNPTA